MFFIALKLDSDSHPPTTETNVMKNAFAITGDSLNE